MLNPCAKLASQETLELHSEAMRKQVQLAIRTVSEANQREHWRTRAKRARSQRDTTCMRLFAMLGRAPKGAAPSLVTITRIAPRSLDSDNLAGSQKHVRDGIQDWLGIDDSELTFAYAQRKGEPRQYAVEIVLEWR